MIAGYDFNRSRFPHTALWVVGEPGVGKTTLCREILASYGPVSYALTKQPKWTTFSTKPWNDISPASRAAAVGSWTGAPFDGGDSIPPSMIKPALDLYAKWFTRAKLVLFDGAKFGNMNAATFVRETLERQTSQEIALAGPQYRLVCLHLVGPNAAQAGRRARALRTGNTQDPTWVKGRRTAAANFAEEFSKSGGTVITLYRDRETSNAAIDELRSA